MDYSYSAFFDPNIDWNNSEGIPFEFSIDHNYEDSQSAVEINLEGTPSEFSDGHTSNAPSERSHDEDILSDTEDDLEGTPSESSIGHDSNAPTAPSSDEDPYDAGSCLSLIHI